ncbi:MAG: DUF502 domain-containing protein [Salinivirgaceae bacterium]|jgi:uncharacterized membrane protein|nr:DUF502 domain-containing protein [Bacteroidales bacterium]
MKKIPKYFVQGLVFVLPLAITFYLIYIVFMWVDNIIPFKIPGLGILVILTSITILGFLFQKLVTTRSMGVLKRMFRKAPLLKVIYTSIKDLFSAFVGKEKKFDKPVLVTMDNVNKIKQLGFVTQTDLSFIDVPEGFISVYIPCSYGILGDMYIVPAENVEPIKGHPAEIMKFIVSGGVSKINPDYDPDSEEQE